MYQPINCSFYDLLEQAATLATPCVIVYMKDQDREATLKGRIANLFTLDKVEYLRFDSGQDIRLDQLISLNGTTLAGFDGSKK